MNRSPLLPKIAAAAVAFQSMAYAVEPVTMVYEATVTRVSEPAVINGSTLPYGFDVKVGDTIAGEFTFTPDGFPVHDVHNNRPFLADQPFDLSIVAGGVRFGSNPYRAAVLNDSTFVSDAGSGFYDEIALTSTVASIDSTAVAAEIDASQSMLSATFGGFDNRFSGPEGLLDLAQLPADPAKWNQFRQERIVLLSLRTTSGSQTQRIAIFATIGDIRVVPEPTGALAGTVAASVCLRRFRRRHESVVF